MDFILNNTSVHTDTPPGATLLDFIRYDRQLNGTKCGCREGDCGACTVLVGALAGENTVVYRSVTSCLAPLANVQGKHVVTVEGINPPDGNLSPVQQALVDESGTQCGFCTVGFVMSMTGFCLEEHPPTPERSVAAIDGNICRCTGYKSIERALLRLNEVLNRRNGQLPLPFAIKNGIVPAYFEDVGARLSGLKQQTRAELPEELPAGYVGGGTDLYVQRAEEMLHTASRHLFDHPALKDIGAAGDYLEIGGLCTVTDWMESPDMQDVFPKLQNHLKLVSSTPIRNMATVAGNLVNASPIGDLTIWLLALDARVVLHSAPAGKREMALRDFYLGYKKMNKTPDEMVVKIRFARPAGAFHFNFEKVCKRTHLDIASVNTALSLRTEQGRIVEAHLSAGGVAPIPLYLARTSAFLLGKTPGAAPGFLPEANAILQAEISPISDVRGSADYKRLLLKQLFQAHFIEMFPGL